MKITPKALQEIKRLKAGDETTKNAHLRLMVVPGGCSGHSYKLGFDHEASSTNDKVFEFEGVSVVVDSKSFILLAGTEVDYSDGFEGKGFTFNNPNAHKTCGCGSSFA